MSTLLTHPWIVAWSIVGAACAFIAAVAAYREGIFEFTGTRSMWGDAVGRTAHAMAIIIVMVVTVATWPLVVILLVINLVMARSDAATDRRLDMTDL